MDAFEDVLQRNPHLVGYLDRWAAQGGSAPTYHPVLTRELRNVRVPNFLYPVGDPIFVHLVKEPAEIFPRYSVIEPELTDEERPVYESVRSQAFFHAPKIRIPDEWAETANALEELLQRVLRPRGLTDAWGPRHLKIPRTGPLLEKLRYVLARDVLGHGPLEALMRDPWIEDINAVGAQDLHVVHKIFGMVRTNVRFPDVNSLDAFLEVMGERMSRPISATHPIVDGTLPNGSRINVIYGGDVSQGGSSFTVRKQGETPFSITQLVAWNTLSPRLAAYLWLCLETGLNVFVSGETASGKTTTLNAMLPFIKSKSKILSAEDTPEVLPPHANWQQLITRERGTEESRVSMYDLLRAALRSRPNYIIVGEIRGAEGSVAFQAMQSGQSTLATFHASSVAKLIQRFSSAPINVPLAFMGSLHVVLVQSAVYVKGKMLRRVVEVDEIEGYSKRLNQVVTRQVFSWDPLSDKHLFAGLNNSYVLEGPVADRLRLSDRREVYRELDRRAALIEKFIQRQEFDYRRMSEFFSEHSEQLPAARPVAAVGGR